MSASGHIASVHCIKVDMLRADYQTGAFRCCSMAFADQPPTSPAAPAAGCGALNLGPRPSCQGLVCQGVKQSRLTSIARLWQPCGRLPPAMLFNARKDPRNRPPHY